MTRTEAKGASAITVENVDDEQLAKAATMLGTKTPEDTVNQALREVVRRKMISDYVALLKQRAHDKYEDPRAAAWQSPNS
ncbi:type II toxin-antitoxin system VapB family antitoxin [Mumia sp. DW29H23]|uniref:type II toxin-antitoxin system VapB family antitoxin n=1 Tax=Mumia sp. DW29H23 TaxID=3421241 RepID=UPI003D68CF96